MRPLLCLLLFLGIFHSANADPKVADPTVAEARALLDKFSKHLVAGEYDAAFSLRSDPFAQIVTQPDGTKAQLEVTKKQALNGMALLKKAGKMAKIEKHEVKIISTENRAGALVVTARVTVEPGVPSKAFYTFKKVDGKVVIVEEEYSAAE